MYGNGLEHTELLKETLASRPIKFRLMADLLLEKLEGTKLYWGDTNLANVSEIRSAYISALRKADAGDYSDLLRFTQGK